MKTNAPSFPGENDGEALARKARELTRAAYQQALAAGESVLVAENSVLYEVHPDGSRVVVKQLEAATILRKGQRFLIP